MPWRPLRRIVFGLAIHPFVPTEPDDLPLQVGDEVYMIEQGGSRGEWFRGYLVAPPSLLAGLSGPDITSNPSSSGTTRNQRSNGPLEARVYSGIFPACCIQLKEALAGIDSDPARPNGTLDDDDDGWDVHELTRWPGEANVPYHAPGEPSPPAPVPLLKIGDETMGLGSGGVPGTSSGAGSAVIDEIAACVREWHSSSLHRLVLSREYGNVVKLGGRTVRLDGARRQLLRGVLTRRERERLVQGITREIRRGGGVVRVGFEDEGAEIEMVKRVSERERQATAPNSESARDSANAASAGPLTTLASMAAVSKLDEFAWAELTKPPPDVHLDDDGVAFDEHTPRHLLVDASATIGEFGTGPDGDPDIPPVSIHVHLATETISTDRDAHGGRILTPISETHIIDLTLRDPHGSIPDTHLRALFSSLSSTDLGEDISGHQPKRSITNINGERVVANHPRKGVYLVVKIVSNEPIQTSDGRESSLSSLVTGNIAPVIPHSNGHGGIMPSVLGSIKGGRRSLMWGRRRPHSPSASVGSVPGSTQSAQSRPGTEDSPSSGSQPAGDGHPAPNREVKTIRRLIAVGTLFLPPNAFVTSAEQKISLPLFQPWDLKDDPVEPHGWDTSFLHAMLPSPSSKYKRISTFPFLKIAVRRFVHQDVEKLTRERPTLFHRIAVSKRIGSLFEYSCLSSFHSDIMLNNNASWSKSGSRSSSMTRGGRLSDFFLVIRGVVLSKTGLLAHPKTGTSPVPATALTSKNIRLTLEVRRTSGQRVENCIFYSGNSLSITAWRTTAASLSDGWDVTIRLSLPAAEFRTSHIVMSVADAPGFPFALGWLPLWDEGAVISNGPHELVLYSYDEHTSSSAIHGRGAYLSLPWNRARAGSQIFPPGVPESEFLGLAVRTTLGDGCGEVSADRNVQGLLDTRSSLDKMDRCGVVQVLRQFELGSEHAIVSSLFGILDRIIWLANKDVPELHSHSNGGVNLTLVELHDALFDALSRVLSLSQDRRFDLNRKLEIYIYSRPDPSARAAVVFLTALQRALARVVEDPMDLKAGRRARDKIKAGGWLFKIIGGRVSSPFNENDGPLTYHHSAPDAVRHSISSLFSTVRQLLRSSSASVLMTQTVLVQHLHSWLAAIINIITLREVWMLSRSVVEASASSTGVLAVWRLILIRQIIRTLMKVHSGSTTSPGDPRGILDEELVRTVVNWIGDCWGERGVALSATRNTAATKAASLDTSRPTAINGQFEAQVRLCAAIVVDLADHLPSAADILPGLVDSYCLLEAAGSFVASDVSDPASAASDDLMADFHNLDSPNLESFDLESDSTALNHLDKEWRPVELFPLSYPFPIPDSATSPSPALLELATLFAKLCSRRIPLAHAQVDDDSEVISNSDVPRLSDTILQSLRMITSMVNSRACPSSWIAVRSMFHRAACMGLLSFLHLLSNSFLPRPEDAAHFPTELWHTFLSAVVTLGASDLLALEASPEQQRRAVWQVAGDVRSHVADILGTAWEALGWAAPACYSQVGIRNLGGFQVQFVPSLVGPVAGLAVGVHAKLRRTAISVLRSMVLSEWALSNDLAAVEAAVADGLAVTMTRGGDRIAPRALVVSDLKAALGVVKAGGEDLTAATRRLVALMDELISLFSVVHAADESAVPSALRLLELARLLDRDELFVRYAHRLARLHCSSGQFAEAGLALRLHADLYAWDNTPVEALVYPRLPAETSSNRKERLYRAAIGLFERAAAWENALDGYGELASQYEHGMFNFAKLARAQRAVATIHEALASGRRPSPRFFRAAFRGLGWPHDLRNRQYIFEAGPDERAVGVATKLQTQYPTCTIVGSDARASDGEGQFLVLAPVSIHRDVSAPVFMRARVSPAIREFASAGRPREFSVSVRRAGNVVAKLVFETAEAFPTILRRSEIIEVRTEPISRIANAVETVTRRTTELAILLRRAGGEVLAGAGEVGLPPAEAVNVFVTRIGRLVDPQDDLCCVSERELLRPASESGDDGAMNPGQDEPLESTDAIDLRPALRAVLLDHTILLRRCICSLSGLPVHVDSNTQSDLTSRFALVWAPELAALDALSPSDGHDGSHRNTVGVNKPAGPGGEDGIKGLTEIMARLTSTVNVSEPSPLFSNQVVPTPEPTPRTDTVPQSKRSSLSFLRRPGGGDAKANNHVAANSVSSNPGTGRRLSALRPGPLNQQSTNSAVRRSFFLSSKAQPEPPKVRQTEPTVPEAIPALLPMSETPQQQHQHQPQPQQQPQQQQKQQQPVMQSHMTTDPPSPSQSRFLSAFGGSGLDLDLDLDLDPDLILALDINPPEQAADRTGYRVHGHGAGPFLNGANLENHHIGHDSGLEVPTLAELPAGR